MVGEFADPLEFSVACLDLREYNEFRSEELGQILLKYASSA